MVVLLGAIAFGWVNRETALPDAEDGIGYWLGIVGGSMMLILLIYPLRKRSRKLAPLGSVGFWFRFHMLLGLFGPLAILYHSRFTWGSLNSAMALWAMIIVASSGLIGRFLYSHVHRGYSNRKFTIRELKREMDELLDDIEHQDFERQDVFDALHAIEDRAISAGQSFWSGARSVIGIEWATRRMEHRLNVELAQAGLSSTASLKQGLEDFFIAVRRAALFAFYDRLLRLWHYLHLPLFVLLVGATILHIVAVHQY